MIGCPHVNCLCLLSVLDIKAEDGEDKITLTCVNGESWEKPEGTTHENGEKIVLNYNDDASGEYHCKAKGDNKLAIYVKLRTCDNCIQLEVGTIMGIIIGDILATILIGVAVYSVASQPKARGYGSSYSKASDRQNLIQNQQNDTYTALQGPSSEYSKLERRANRK
ncbi:T-cell surface glycoprotein CD3 delta chain-like [Paramormyrops kingsleyae]|uniref:T-cell surface glycoprotein CD3 delta chain-like n=1 Tax=Paramormyrops kingsleyae TaxID=1676925 RepID=UPI003B9788FE